MSKPILKVEKLTKRYPNGVLALQNVSFSVMPGEFLVIIGLSGSGKSTLLKSLNHLVEPTSGQILFGDKDITRSSTKDARETRQQMAMIFQQFNLIPRHTVLQNALTGRLGKTGTLKSIFGRFSKKDISDAYSFLELVGIRDKANIRADQLSGGQQQRVAIARALMQNPSVLLADEPVASLDPATCHVVMDYLKKVNRELGITVICNLHFLSLVRQYADRVIALKQGQIVFEGSPDQISAEWFRRIYGEDAREVEVE